MRYTPRISFELDMGVKKSIEITQILNDLLPDASSPDADPDIDGISTGCDISDKGVSEETPECIPDDESPP